MSGVQGSPSAENLGGGKHVTAEPVCAMGPAGSLTGGIQTIDTGPAERIDTKATAHGMGKTGDTKPLVKIDPDGLEIGFADGPHAPEIVPFGQL